MRITFWKEAHVYKTTDFLKCSTAYLKPIQSRLPTKQSATLSTKSELGIVFILPQGLCTHSLTPARFLSLFRCLVKCHFPKGPSPDLPIINNLSVNERANSWCLGHFSLLISAPRPSVQSSLKSLPIIPQAFTKPPHHRHWSCHHLHFMYCHPLFYLVS